MFIFLSELKSKKMHKCKWKKFRKRLHFIRNSGLKKVRITVYFFWHFLTDTLYYKKFGSRKTLSEWQVSG